jgi:hypothetical protein
MNEHERRAERIAGPLFAKTTVHATDLTNLLRTQPLSGLPDVARFGDGEIMGTLGWPDNNNCDGHPYSAGLGAALMEALETFCKLGCWLGNWAWCPLSPWLHGVVDVLGSSKIKWTDHELFMMGHGQNPDTTQAMFLAIRAFAAHKVLVGPERISGSNGFLRTGAHVTVPESNGWEEFAEVHRQLFAVLGQNPASLVLLCYGMPSKPLMSEVMKTFPRCRCFDLGSALDPICGVRSRPAQLPEVKLREMFGEAMP